jgi:hypothetical protein
MIANAEIEISINIPPVSALYWAVTAIRGRENSSSAAPRAAFLPA